MLENIYNQTVTILNKLQASDNLTHRDIWYKSVVTDAVWYSDSARSAGAHSVFIGRYITVLIPFHDNYLPYLQWREEAVDRDNTYTASMGDYIIRGVIEETPTSENITKIVQKYGENCCLIRHHNDNYDRFGARVQLKIQGV